MGLSKRAVVDSVRRRTLGKGNATAMSATPDLCELDHVRRLGAPRRGQAADRFSISSGSGAVGNARGSGVFFGPSRRPGPILASVWPTKRWPASREIVQRRAQLQKVFGETCAPKKPPLSKKKWPAKTVRLAGHVVRHNTGKSLDSTPARVFRRPGRGPRAGCRLRRLAECHPARRG